MNILTFFKVILFGTYICGSHGYGKEYDSYLRRYRYAGKIYTIQVKKGK